MLVQLDRDAPERRRLVGLARPTAAGKNRRCFLVHGAGDVPPTRRASGEPRPHPAAGLGDRRERAVVIAEPLQENGPIEGGLRPLHVVPQPDEHLLDVFQQRQRFVEAPLRREDGGHRTPFLRPRSRAQLPVGQPERQLAQARRFGAFPERLDHVRFDDGLLDERSSERLDVPRLERARSVSRQAKPPIAFQLQLEQGGRRFAELPVRDAPGGQIGLAREQQFLECALRAYLLLDNRAHQRDGIVCIPRRHRGCVPPNAPMRPVAMCVKTRRDASIDRSSGTWLLQLESWPIDTFDRAEHRVRSGKGEPPCRTDSHCTSV